MDSGWERLFWLVFERSANPMALIDEDRRLVADNAAAAALWDGEASELIGRSIDETIVASEREQAAAQWRAFLLSGDYAGERDLVRRDGSLVHIHFAARLADIGGRRLALYVAVRSPDEVKGRTVRGGASAPLTEREREVVTLIALGHDTRAIAAAMHISPETVRTHVRNAMAKLGSHTRAQLVASAMCAGAIHGATVEPG